MKFWLASFVLLPLALLQLCILEVDGHQAGRRVLPKLAGLPRGVFFPGQTMQDEPIELNKRKLVAFFHRREHDLKRSGSNFIYGASFRKLFSIKGLTKHLFARNWSLLWCYGIGAVASTFPKQSKPVLNVLSRILRRLALLSHWVLHSCVIFLKPYEGLSLVAIDISSLVAQRVFPTWLYTKYRAIFVAPIKEEILFRCGFEDLCKQLRIVLGKTLHSLQKVQPRTAGKLWFGQFELWHLASSFIFGCAHISNCLESANLHSPGTLGLAVARASYITVDTLFNEIPAYRKGGVIASIGAHMAWNFGDSIYHPLVKLR